MNTVKLISEEIQDVEYICEEQENGKKDYKIKGVFMQADIKNRNGRVYPMDVLEKGDDLDSRIERNFGMMRPEGYRKTNRLMKLADKFNIPIISFIDTPGAYPGVEIGRASCRERV